MYLPMCDIIKDVTILNSHHSESTQGAHDRQPPSAHLSALTAMDSMDEVIDLERWIHPWNQFN